MTNTFTFWLVEVKKKWWRFCHVVNTSSCISDDVWWIIIPMDMCHLTTSASSGKKTFCAWHWSVAHSVLYELIYSDDAIEEEYFVFPLVRLLIVTLAWSHILFSLFADRRHCEITRTIHIIFFSNLAQCFCSSINCSLLFYNCFSFEQLHLPTTHLFRSCITKRLSQLIFSPIWLPTYSILCHRLFL